MLWCYYTVIESVGFGIWRDKEVLSTSLLPGRDDLGEGKELPKTNLNFFLTKTNINKLWNKYVCVCVCTSLLENRPKNSSQFKKLVEPWLVWLSWLGVIPQSKGSPARFPVKAHTWVEGSRPGQSEQVQEATDRCFFLTSVFFSLPSPLSKNKQIKS